MTSSPLTRTLLLLAVLAILAPARARAGGDWNDAGVAWQPYEAGLGPAKKDKKPVLLVFFTEWCPHCTNYSEVFHDPKVVEQSKQFVMIRLDKDKNAELSKKYAPDGEYIPRTYFLSSDGELDRDDLTRRATSTSTSTTRSSPDGILAGMQAALAKLH